MKDKTRPCRPLLVPDRKRVVRPPFAFIPARFLHDGFFAGLGHLECALYLFLVLAGDRNGVSYYSYDRICSTLEITLDDYIAARNSLIKKDLIAFDGRVFQVLSLPQTAHVVQAKPLSEPDDFEASDPATVRKLIRDSLADA